jgi:excisionase family DNA binding protein
MVTKKRVPVALAADEVVYARPAVAAKSRGISEATIYRRLRDGSIEGRKMGRRTLISLRSLDDFIASLPSA